MADIQTILSDPDFQASSDATKREVLIANDPDFAKSSLRTQDDIIRSLRAGPVAPSELDTAKRAALPTMLGAAGGVAGGLVGGPPGAFIGSGLGAAAGEGLNQLTPWGRTDTPIKDILMEGAGGVVGEGVGRGLAYGGKVIGGALGITPREGAQDILGSFRALKVDPKVTDVSGSSLPAVIERALSQMPTGGTVIKAGVEKQAGQLTAAAEEFFLKTLGPDAAREKVATGLKASKAIEQNVARTRAIEDQLWDTTTREGRGVMVDITSIKQAAQDIAFEQARMTPGQQSKTLMKDTAAVLNAPDQVPWEQARAWQKGFGSAIERGELISKTPSGEAKLLWKSITQDMEAAAAASGNQNLATAWTTARDFASERRKLFVDSSVAKVLKANPEDVVKMIDAGGGPTAVKNAKAAIDDPEAWDYVRRHIFEGVLDSARDKNARGFLGEVISGPRLDRRLKSMGEETLAELLSPTEREALTNVSTVANAIRAGEKYAATGYTSTTPQGLGVQGALVGMGSYLGSAVGMNPVAAGALTYVMVPPLFAKALMSPKATEIIASPGFASIATGLRLGGKIGAEGITALTKLAAAMATDIGQGRPVPVPATRGLFPGPTGQGGR